MKFLPINLKHIDISKNLTKKGHGSSTPLFTQKLNMMINKDKTDVTQKGEGMALLFLAIMLANSHHINNNKIGNCNINNTKMNKDVSFNILKNINQENLNTILNKLQKIIHKDAELKNFLQNLSKFLNIYIKKNTTVLNKSNNIKKQNFNLFTRELSLKDLTNKDNNQIYINQFKKLVYELKDIYNKIKNNEIIKNQQNKITEKFIENLNNNLSNENIKKINKINKMNTIDLVKKENFKSKTINIANNKINSLKDIIDGKCHNELSLKKIFQKNSTTKSEPTQIDRIIKMDIKDTDLKHTLKELSNVLKKLINLSDGELEQKSHNIKLIKDINKTNLDFKLNLNNDVIKLNPQVETIKSESSQISQDIRNNVLRQIEEGIFKNLGQGRRQISIKLHPPELGSLKLIMHMHNKEVSLVIHTQNNDVADGLNKHIANFEKSFEQQGLKLVKVEVKNDLFSGQENSWQNFQGTGGHGGAPSQKRRNSVSTVLMGEREIESMDPDGLRNRLLKNQIYIVA